MVGAGGHRDQAEEDDRAAADADPGEGTHSLLRRLRCTGRRGRLDGHWGPPFLRRNVVALRSQRIPRRYHAFREARRDAVPVAPAESPGTALEKARYRRTP